MTSTRHLRDFDTTDAAGPAEVSDGVPQEITSDGPNSTEVTAPALPPPPDHLASFGAFDDEPTQPLANPLDE